MMTTESESVRHLAEARRIWREAHEALCEAEKSLRPAQAREAETWAAYCEARSAAYIATAD